jgi:hypothetical protein
LTYFESCTNFFFVIRQEKDSKTESNFITFSKKNSKLLNSKQAKTQQKLHPQKLKSIQSFFPSYPPLQSIKQSYKLENLNKPLLRIDHLPISTPLNLPIKATSRKKRNKLESFVTQLRKTVICKIKLPKDLIPIYKGQSNFLLIFLHQRPQTNLQEATFCRQAA